MRCLFVPQMGFSQIIPDGMPGNIDNWTVDANPQGTGSRPPVVAQTPTVKQPANFLDINKHLEHYSKGPSGQ
jgi:hypothetical protein